MSKIFVVIGTTGEYSDRSEWLVLAFRDEEKAKEHVINATRRANEIQVTRPSQYSVAKELNEFDPNMSMDYTGTSYSYSEVELKEITHDHTRRTKRQFR